MMSSRILLLTGLMMIGPGALPAGPVPAAAQSSQGDVLRIIGADGASSAIDVPLHRDRGFTAISARTLSDLGWSLSRGEETLGVALGNGPAFRARAGLPYLVWQGQRVQLTHAPYIVGRDFFLPLQVVSDVLPYILNDLYRYDDQTRTLHVQPLSTVMRRPESSPIRVVVIDAGHGGEDPGARGPGGTLEKDVALGIALNLARELRKDPTLEVHMIRDRDVYVHPWERGEMALGWKGDRPGVFLSIHANSVTSATARGFETYFLSEARTEHERRVAAVENAPIYTGRVNDAEAPPEDAGLTAILRELRYVDDQHWSALLADMVQNELGSFHPGPNRGVKQAPLAVLTNSLMPSVLIEVGFISNRAEERVLAGSAFQQDAADSIARAVRSFFQRYPPGRATAADG